MYDLTMRHQGTLTIRGRNRANAMSERERYRIGQDLSRRFATLTASYGT